MTSSYFFSSSAFELPFEPFFVTGGCLATAGGVANEVREKSAANKPAPSAKRVRIKAPEGKIRLGELGVSYRLGKKKGWYQSKSYHRSDVTIGSQYWRVRFSILSLRPDTFVSIP